MYDREQGGIAQDTSVKPTAADIEIVERGGSGPGEYGIIVPTEVRINGHPVLTPVDQPVRVHEIEVGGQPDAVQVTLTVFARRVRVDYEPG